MSESIALGLAAKGPKTPTLARIQHSRSSRIAWKQFQRDLWRAWVTACPDWRSNSASYLLHVDGKSPQTGAHLSSPLWPPHLFQHLLGYCLASYIGLGNGQIAPFEPILAKDQSRFLRVTSTVNDIAKIAIMPDHGARLLFPSRHAFISMLSQGDRSRPASFRSRSQCQWLWSHSTLFPTLTQYVCFSDFGTLFTRFVYVRIGRSV